MQWLVHQWPACPLCCHGKTMLTFETFSQNSTCLFLEVLWSILKGTKECWLWSMFLFQMSLTAFRDDFLQEGIDGSKLMVKTNKAFFKLITCLNYLMLCTTYFFMSANISYVQRTSKISTCSLHNQYSLSFVVEAIVSGFLKIIRTTLWSASFVRLKGKFVVYNYVSLNQSGYTDWPVVALEGCNWAFVSLKRWKGLPCHWSWWKLDQLWEKMLSVWWTFCLFQRLRADEIDQKYKHIHIKKRMWVPVWFKLVCMFFNSAVPGEIMQRFDD